MAFTFFFRDSHTIKVAINLLLPKIEELKEIKIWDAGCAMGQEPYTFAMLLAEQMGHFAFKKVLIHATDIDETDSFNEIVRSGVYQYKELERIPKTIFEKYFSQTNQPDFYQIQDKIKNRVAFTKHDLLSLKPIDYDFDLIICKNVLLHFPLEKRIEVINMYYCTLRDGGLFITEQTQELPETNKNKFRLVANDANIYEKIN
jgi:chemotaxis protein methyltransferase CheR